MWLMMICSLNEAEVKTVKLTFNWFPTSDWAFASKMCLEGTACGWKLGRQDRSKCVSRVKLETSPAGKNSFNFRNAQYVWKNFLFRHRIGPHFLVAFFPSSISAHKFVVIDSRLDLSNSHLKSATRARRRRRSGDEEMAVPSYISRTQLFAIDTKLACII